MTMQLLDQRVLAWLAEPLGDEARKLILASACAPGVERIAVMPDAHAADAVCNGCVIATSDRIYPQAIGQDIGCGFSAVRLSDIGIFHLPPDIASQCLRVMSRAVPIIRHGKRTIVEESVLAALGELSQPHLANVARRDGLVQFGTLGRGNHFLELQRDDDGALWLMVHSGSRAMGRVLYEHALAEAQHDSACNLAFLPVASESAREYIHNADWAVRYAAASRLRMLQLTSDALGDILDVDPAWSTLRCSPHNTLTCENIEGASLFVHRKGAARALTIDEGIIAGSAGTFSVHTRGKACAAALNSCSHGAGRVMSRTDARTRISVKDLQRTMQRVTFDSAQSRRLLEEAPGAYRDLRVVMEAQRDLVTTVRRLTPLISCKAV